MAGRGTESGVDGVDGSNNEGDGEGADVDSKSWGERPASSNITWA